MTAGFGRITAIVGVLLLGIYFNDLYDNYRITSHLVLVQQFLHGSRYRVLAPGGEQLRALGHSAAPKGMMVYGSLLVLLVLPLWRILFISFLTKAIGAQRILFMGSSQAVREIIARISERAEFGLTAIGYLEDGLASDSSSERREPRGWAA